MNKAIYICAAAALALASCSNDEVVERAKENGISFRSVVGINTRATEVNTGWLQQNDKLYVTTFKENGDRLYDETEYSYNGSAWIASPPQSWNGNSKLNFFLAYPKLSKWQAGFELTKDNKTVQVSVDEDIPDQKDYVVANVTGNKTNFNDPISVDLIHVLSSVEIKAMNTNEAFKYKVKGIRLCGVNKDVTIDLSTINSTLNIGHSTNMRNYELIYDTPVELGSKAESLMGNAKIAILPPQTGGDALKWDGSKTSNTAGDYVGYYLSVKINVTSKYGSSVYPAGSTADDATYGWAAISVPFDWESGKKYVYTLDFSEGAGRVDPTDPGAAVTPDGKVDPAKGMPILGKRIKFGIAVSPWKDGGDQDATLTDGIKFTVGVDSWTDKEKDAEIN